MTNDFRESVMEAVERCDGSKLSTLIKSGANLSLDFFSRCHTGYETPLVLAVELRHNNIVDQLIQAGANVDYPSARITPLMRAVICGNYDACLLLLNHGADVHLARANVHLSLCHLPVTAFYFAADHGKLRIAELLIEYGAKVHDLTKPWDDIARSPIAASIFRKHHSISKLILDNCSKTNITIPLNILFNLAIKHENEECAIMILQQGYYPVVDKASCTLSLYKNAFSGMANLMSLVVELNPQVLQDEWLLKNHPLSDMMQQVFPSWMLKKRKQPARLDQLCRSVILVHLESPYVPRIKELPLPKSLRMFLTIV